MEKGEHVTWKKLGEDRSIILDLNSGRYFSLNQTATAIWQRVISNRSLGQIAKEISQSFETDQAEVQIDIQEVAGVLVNKGLLTEMAVDESTGAQNEEPIQTDSYEKPYFKPEIEEHEPIKQVTAGTVSSSCSSGHYWYPC